MLDLGLPGAKGLSQGYLRVGRRRGEGLASVSLKQIRVRVSGPHTTPLLQEPKTRGTAPLAHMLFTTHYVPAPSAPTNTETQLLYCHRLGIPLPCIAPPLRHHCYHTCPHYPPSRPNPAAHYFTEYIGHLYRHMACGACGY